MGAEGISEASDLSVLASNYIDAQLMRIRGVTRSHPQLTGPRMEMVRYSLETLARETGVTAVDVQNRMTDFGIDAFWLSHEPWMVPEPFTPEAGELWSEGRHRRVDRRAPARLRRGLRAAGTRPVNAPHNQVTHRVARHQAGRPQLLGHDLARLPAQARITFTSAARRPLPGLWCQGAGEPG